MAKVELKKPVVEEISESIKDAQAVIIASYSGITVEQDTALRKEMREAGVHYKVYKNTMMNFAFKGTDCEPLCKHLEGPNAVAISKDDATAPARILAKYAKDVKTLKLVAGVVQRGSSWQTAWKHPVSHRKPGSRAQSDRREQSRSLSFGLKIRSFGFERQHRAA